MRFSLRRTCAVLAVLSGLGVRAGNPSLKLVVPRSWRNTTLSASLGEIHSLTRGAIDSLLEEINSETGLVEGLGMAGTYVMLSTISSTDKINQTATNFRDQVLSSLDTVFNQGLLTQTTGNNENLGLLGMAFYHAWRAYNDTGCYERAVQVWETLNTYTISPAEASTGRSRTRTVAIAPFCNDASTAGGVFLNTGESSQDTTITGKSAGTFLTLSALLYGATSNSTFGNAAKTTAAFIQNQLFNGTIVQNSITLSNCHAEAQPLFSSSSGLFIEGLARLSAHDPSRVPQLEEVVSSAVTFSSWTNKIGIQSEPDHPLRALFIRALSIARMQTQDRSPRLSKFIESYINVQFNAMQTKDSKRDDTNPLDSQLHMLTTNSATLQFHVALDANNKQPSGSDYMHGGPKNSAGNGSHGGGHDHESSKIDVGVIVGATIGGVAGTLILFAGAILLWRRYRRRRQLRPSIGKYGGRDMSTYESSSGGVLSTIILPPNSVSSASLARPRRSTLVHSQYYSFASKQTSPTQWDTSSKILPLPPTCVKNFGEKSRHTRGEAADRSLALPKDLRLLPPDWPLPEQSVNITTLLNRFAAMLALSGQSVDVKQPHSEV